MVREVAIDKIRSYGLPKEMAEHILDDITEHCDLDKIYYLRVDAEKHIVKCEKTSLSADELYKAAYIHLTSEFFLHHDDMTAIDAIKLMKLHKNQLEKQAMKEVLEHGESR